MQTFLGVPITVRGRIFGRLYLTEKRGDQFTKDDERIAMTFASQAGVAIENARLSEALRDLAVLEERERISKELHDGVIQSIYSVGMSLQGTQSLLERDPELARKRVDDVIRELDSVVRDVRSYIFELRPSLVEDRGIADAIRDLVRDLEVNTLAEAEVRLEREACESLTERQQSHVIQIVREVLSNVARHSQASYVGVSCALENASVLLQIADDGVGFDRQTAPRGQGLRNIDERLRQLGGSIEIRPREPRGTIHALRIPVEAPPEG
jgi:signal transduction histidine kinase